MTKNSETNGASPGSDSVARPAMRNTPDSTGATFCTPPKSAILLVPCLLVRNPATKNRAAVEIPWLSMYRAAPACDCGESAKTPRTMKPKCEIDVYAMSRIRSVCAIARSNP